MPHLYCCRKHVNSYDTNVLKQMLRTLQFCLVNIFIHKFFQFFGVYFYRYMLYMTGLSLWDSEHEHNTVNMLCSLKKKKNCHITIPTGLLITATFQQGPLSSVPKVGHCGEV